jgi:uncharacterized protein (DUF1778 family)
MTTTPPRATARFEFRVDPAGKQAIADAASVLGMDASDFARDVLLDRAEEVLADRAHKTVVPASYFEDLLAALDGPTQPNEAMRKAIARARNIVKADHLGS